MGRTPISKLRIALAALAVGLVTVAPAASAPPVPSPLGPPDGSESTFLPTLSWSAVAGADKYVVEIGANAAVDPALFTITTKNTRAVPDKTVPNGTYYWRVQSVDVNGNASPFSDPMTVVKNWAEHPTLVGPANGATITYPEDPFVLRWTGVEGAAKYRVHVASDPALSALIGDGEPMDVQATNLAPAILLPANTYYWAVTPLDAQGNEGSRSSVRSFTWEWPSQTDVSMVDLRAETELFDPEFSWDPVPGAARYEVEINSSSDFASGSRVCCDDPTIATRMTPLEVYRNNTYYWRVKAIDRANNAGQWNYGEPFAKTFDNYPDLSELAIKDLRMRDYDEIGTDQDAGTPGYQTELPILTWDPVPGAASYQVDVVPFDTVDAPDACDWGVSSFDRWTVKTASTSWTPLGWGLLATPPHPTGSGMTVSKDQNSLDPGQAYCARVRARSGRVTFSEEIWGDLTYLDDGTGAAFTFTSFPSGGACSPSCQPGGYMGADDYVLPQRGEVITGDADHGNMPLFTWNPIAGKAGYWVIVAKDPTFTTIVDYAFTRIPAYAVRTASAPRTYPDETTSYYWVVLPSTGTNGSGAPGDVTKGAAADFEKQTAPPDLLAPADGADFTGQPTFEWTPTRGARRYHLEVSYESTFGTLVDDVTTASTSYTALRTYNAATTIYWRVQAEDENNIGLTWSETGNFQLALPAPVVDDSNLGTSDNIPVIFWSAVPGAVEYTLKVQDADSEDDFSGFPSTAASWEKFTGAGILTFRVRADFPKSSGSTLTQGPWSDPVQFVHTMHEPQNASEDVGPRKLALAWDAKTGMKSYRVQISEREDFSPYIESKTTDNPSFAPTLTSLTYQDAQTLYWRVAAVDADSNVGDFTGARSFEWPGITTPAAPLKTFSLSTSGRLVRNRVRTFTVRVMDSATLAPVVNASVRASGAGVLITKLSNLNGAAAFRFKPTQLGKVAFRVSRNGYQTKTIYRRVVRP